MKKQDTKQQIQLAMEGLMQRKTVERVTVNELVERSGITRQTFYHHFKDKYDVVHRVFLMDSRAGLSKIAVGDFGWDGAITHVLTIFKNRRGFYYNAMKSRGQNSLSGYMAAFDIAFHTEMLKKSLRVEALEPEMEITVRFWCFGVVQVMEDWVLRGMQEPEQFLGSMLASCIPDAIRVETNHLTPQSWEEILCTVDGL